MHNDEVVQVEPLCSHHRLKIVLFMDFCWTKLEIELAKFFLKNAIILEEMTIISKGGFNSEIGALKEQLLSFPTGSDCVLILFQQ